MLLWYSAARLPDTRHARSPRVLYRQQSSGALVDGYSFSLEKQRSDNAYAVLKAGPYASAERGSRTSGGVLKSPEQMLVLFAKMDGPGRKVREALSILDLDCVVYPSTRSWPGLGYNRQHAVLLRDPNAGGKELVDADDIVEYLFETYGSGVEAMPWVMKRGNGVGRVLMALAIWLRGGRGCAATSSGAEDQDPLTVEFWAYEASPFCGVAAEAIYAAGLPHVLRTVARGSSKRDALFEAEGHFQAPYFVDGSVGMFESAAIIEYVESRS